MSVGSICQRPARTATRDQSIREAAEQMDRERVGSLVVTEEGRPVGLVTDRDVALGVLVGDRDANTTSVVEVAAAPVISLREELSLSQVSDRMRSHGLRRVPVIEASGRVVGVASADDLVRLIARELSAIADVAAEQVPPDVRERVAEPGWMRGVRHYVKDMVTATRGEPVRVVARRMSDTGVGCVVIVDDALAPEGVVTDRDLAVRVVAKDLDADATPVSDVMTASVVQVDSGVRIQEVARVMSDQGVRRVPVTHDGKLCGIVSYDDLLVALGRELHDIGQAARGAIERALR